MFGFLSCGGLDIRGKIFYYLTIINITLPDWYDTLFHTISKTRHS